MARPSLRTLTMICCTSYTAIGSTPLNGSSTISWPTKSDDQVKRGRLAGTVRSEQTDNFAGARVDVHSIDNRATAINFHELFGGKNIVDVRLRRQPHFRCRMRCRLADHGVSD